MDMIERVAKAIYESKLFQPARAGDPWEGPSNVTKIFCRDAARAAIEAMRKPTYEMMDACDVHDVARKFLVTELAASTIWGAMIDAATKPASANTAHSETTKETPAYKADTLP